jgi:spore coat protein U-like protein
MQRLMKWIGGISAAIFVGLGSAALAQAGTATANMAVQITITASCTINATTLDFLSNAGTVLVSSNVDAQANVSVTCTSGSPYSIGMNNGANASASQRRMISGGNFLNYNLYTDTARTAAWTTTTQTASCTGGAGTCVLGTGTGSSQSVTIYGRVPSIGTAPPPGTYTDTVTMTITY